MTETLFDEQLKPSLSEINRFTHFVEGLAISSKVAYRLNLVVDELLTNVISYGQATTIHVNASLKEDQFEIIITDDGKPFNPLSDVEKPDTQSSLEDRQIGGLGVHFAKEIMNELNYEYKDNKNTLRMTLDVGTDHG